VGCEVAVATSAEMGRVTVCKLGEPGLRTREELSEEAGERMLRVVVIVKKKRGSIVWDIFR
jgi:hypothetical protein